MLTRLLCGVFALAVAAGAIAQPRVDLALINGTIITVDGRNTVAQAIAIGGGQSWPSARPRKSRRGPGPAQG